MAVWETATPALVGKAPSSGRLAPFCVAGDARKGGNVSQPAAGALRGVFIAEGFAEVARLISCDPPVVSHTDACPV